MPGRNRGRPIESVASILTPARPGGEGPRGAIPGIRSHGHRRSVRFHLAARPRQYLAQAGARDFRAEYDIVPATGGRYVSANPAAEDAGPGFAGAGARDFDGRVVLGSEGGVGGLYAFGCARVGTCCDGCVGQDSIDQRLVVVIFFFFFKCLVNVGHTDWNVQMCFRILLKNAIRVQGSCSS